QRAFRLYKLIPFTAKERPIETGVEFIDVHRTLLPGRRGAQHDWIPGHLKQRLSVVVPGSIHHSDRARLLTIANEINDVLSGRVEIGKNLVPVLRPGTDKLLKAGILEGLDRSVKV